MNNFFAELKRRNMVRVAIAYVVVSWPKVCWPLGDYDFACGAARE